MVNDTVERIEFLADWGDIDLQEDVGVSSLGSMQQQVLTEVARSTEPGTLFYRMSDEKSIGVDPCDRSEEWVRHQTVVNRLIDRSSGRTRNSVQSAMSRSVSSLIDRGLVVGAVRAWAIVAREHSGHTPTGKRPWNRDCRLWDEDDRPPIKWIQLTPNGWIAAYQTLTNDDDGEGDESCRSSV